MIIHSFICTFIPLFFLFSIKPQQEYEYFLHHQLFQDGWIKLVLLFCKGDEFANILHVRYGQGFGGIKSRSVAAKILYYTSCLLLLLLRCVKSLRRRRRWRFVFIYGSEFTCKVLLTRRERRIMTMKWIMWMDFWLNKEDDCNMTWKTYLHIWILFCYAGQDPDVAVSCFTSYTTYLALSYLSFSLIYRHNGYAANKSCSWLDDIF